MGINGALRVKPFSPDSNDYLYEGVAMGLFFNLNFYADFMPLSRCSDTIQISTRNKEYTVFIL